MDISKGLQTTGFPYNSEDASWIRAINAIMRDSAKAVSNEKGMLSIKEDDYWFLGSIQADDGIFIFEQKTDALDENVKFRISYIDLTTATPVFNIILDTTYITYDVVNSIHAIEGEFTYNKNNERIIAWSGGKLVTTNDSLLINSGIFDRNFCIFNVDNIPFIHGLYDESYDPPIPPSNPHYKEIIGADLANTNREHLVLFQNPTIKEPMYSLNNIAFGGGVLKSGVYYVGIRYKYPDKDTTNVISFSKVISIIPGGSPADGFTIDGGLSDEVTGKSINMTISNLDNKYNEFEVIVYGILGNTHRAFIDNVYSIRDRDSVDILITGLQFSEIDINEATIDTLYMNKAISVSQFQNRLLLSNIEVDEIINYQKWALDIKVEWVYEDFVSLDGLRGSYKDELVIFDKKGFMPGEVLALYATLIGTNGVRYPSAHVPGRPPVAIMCGHDEDDLILDVNTSTCNIGKANCITVNKDYKFFHSFPNANLVDNKMNYWENKDEQYPDDEDNFISPRTGLDLTNKNVRHHKFPEANQLDTQFTYTYDDVPHEEIGIEETLHFELDDAMILSRMASTFINIEGDGYDTHYSYSESARYNMVESSQLVEIEHTTLTTHELAGGTLKYKNPTALCTPLTNGDLPVGTIYNSCQNLVIKAKKYVTVDLSYFLRTAGIQMHCYDAEAFASCDYICMIETSIYKVSASPDYCTTPGSTINELLVRNCETIYGYSVNGGSATTCSSHTQSTALYGTISNIILSPGESIIVYTNYRFAIDEEYANDQNYYQNTMASVLSSILGDGGGAGSFTGGYPVVITVNQLDDSLFSGSVFGKVLGLKLSNIAIPKTYIDKIQAVEFHYAKRKIETATRITDVAMVDNNSVGLGGGVLTNSIKSHPFDIFQNGIKNIPFTHFQAHTMNVEYSTTGVWVNYTGSYTPSAVHSMPKPINNSLFRPNDNNKTHITNALQEENIYHDTDDLILDQSDTVVNIDRGSIGTLSVFKNNMYMPFDKQELVSTGFKILVKRPPFYPTTPVNKTTFRTTSAGSTYYLYINTDDITSLNYHTDNVYGGDTFFNMQGMYIANGSSATVAGVKTLMFPRRGFSNVSLRYGNDVDKLYFIRNSKVALDNLATDSSASNLMVMPTNWGYYTDYSALNNIKMPFPYSTNNTYLDINPYRVVRSDEQHTEIEELRWRKFRPLNYYEMDKEKGEIISTGVLDKAFVINMKNTTYVAILKDVLSTGKDTESTYLGAGDIFDRAPQEVMTSDSGYAGCSHGNSTLATRLGYIFIDSTRYKLFMFTGKELHELNNIGIKSLIDTVFKNYPTLDDDILHNNGIAIAYDEENERLLFNFHVYSTTQYNTKTPLDKHPTLSFDLGKKRWVSYHDVNISSFIQGRNRLFSVINTIDTYTSSVMFEQNRNLFGLYNNEQTHKEFSIDMLFNNKETIKDIYEAIVWETEVISKSRENGTGAINDANNELLHYDKTLTGIMIYNDTQCSEILEVNNSNIQEDASGNPTSDWQDEQQGRDNNGVWSFNDFRDAVINNKIKFFTYDMEPTANVDYTFKDWQDESNFIGKYIVVRLIFNNIPTVEDDGTLTEYKLKLNDVNINKRKSYK